MTENSQQPDPHDARMLLFIPVAWLAYELGGLLMAFSTLISAYMFVHSRVSEGVQIAIVVSLDLLILALFIAGLSVPDEEQQVAYQQEVNQEAVRESKRFPEHVEVRWKAAGFEVGTMDGETKEFLTYYRPATVNDLPCFNIYDQTLANVNLADLPDPGVPFAVSIHGGGVFTLTPATLQPFLLRFRGNLKWLNLSGKMEASILHWSATQTEFQILVGGPHRTQFQDLRFKQMPFYSK